MAVTKKQHTQPSPPQKSRKNKRDVCQQAKTNINPCHTPYYSFMTCFLSHRFPLHIFTSEAARALPALCPHRDFSLHDTLPDPDLLACPRPLIILFFFPTWHTHTHSPYAKPPPPTSSMRVIASLLCLVAACSAFQIPSARRGKPSPRCHATSFSFPCHAPPRPAHTILFFNGIKPRQMRRYSSHFQSQTLLSKERGSGMFFGYGACVVWLLVLPPALPTASAAATRPPPATVQTYIYTPSTYSTQHSIIPYLSSLLPPVTPSGRSNMAPQMLGNFFSPKKAPLPEPSTSTPTKGGKASAGRLNLKSIPKEAPPAPKKRASTSAGVKMPAFSFGAKKPAASTEPTARVVNGKLQVCSCSCPIYHYVISPFTH